MFDLTQLLVASAMAQGADASAVAGATNGTMATVMNFAPLILIFAVFYVLIIRPQQKKIDEQGKMIKALQRGDRIVTSGGIYGKIVRLEGDDALVVEIADNVQVKMLRSAVQSLAVKTPAAGVITGGNDNNASKAS